jgi:hypothetical protein
MPIAWKDKFADASKTTHDLMMLKLQDYMRWQSEKDSSSTSSPPRNMQRNYQDNQSMRGSDSQGWQSNCDSPYPSNNTNSLPWPLPPGHAGHTISQRHQWQYHEQQQCKWHI